MNAYEAMIKQGVGLNIPREKIEQRARELYPQLAAIADGTEVKNARTLEKREQMVITKMARVLGFTVDNTSQGRPSKVAPGLPDLWLRCVARKLAGWWETKRQVGGERSSEQVDFGNDCIACGIPYGFGDRFDFARWLQAHGIDPPPIPSD
jgi:hypothetical protein